MRNLFLFIFFLNIAFVSAQTDSTKLPIKDTLREVLPDSAKTQAVKDSSNAVPVPTAATITPIPTPAPPVQNNTTSAAPPDTTHKHVKHLDKKRYNQIRTSPDTIKYASLDSLNYDQLLEYYLTEPEPTYSGKRFSKGDSLYGILNPLTAPTKTVEGEALYHEFYEAPAGEPDSMPSGVSQLMRPKIAIGFGRLGFHGDLYGNKYQPNIIGRPAFDIAISQRITRYLQLDFNVMFGKVGANENATGRHENIQTEIRAGGVNLLYDFGNYLPDKLRVRPFVSFGVYGFEFLSKTDIKDKDGLTYNYWDDGSIRDKAQGSADAQNAKMLTRDYTYESDVRELNRDGFGKYTESAWAFPLGIGVVMKVTDRIDMKVNYQYYFTTTDYIDGITSKGSDMRQGNKRKDAFSYGSISLQYDLIAKKRNHMRPAVDTIDYNDPYLMALFNQDNDHDSVIDINDQCLGTPPGVKVDSKGCPLDGDNDAVPDFRDDELATAAGLGVTLKGVAQTDEYWQKWYDQYMNDSLGGEKTTEYTGNIYAVSKKKGLKKDPYTVELMRYNGAIPSDELAFLLSIGDINSTTLEDGTTVVYTSGNYEKLGTAIKRRDEFREDGNKKAGVSMFKGRDVVQLPENELESLLQSEIADLLKMNVNDSVNNLSNYATASNPDEAFNRNEIVYRVQLGAFRNKISTSVFGASTGVLELKTGENVYRYVTKGYSTIEEAAATRADLVLQGYSDAFVTAYRGGRRIPMSETKATVEKGYTEDLSEDKTFNSIDKSLLSFKVQLGPLKRRTQEAAMDARVKNLPNVQKRETASGSIRYTAGDFPGQELAEEYKKVLEGLGFNDAFVIPTFKGEVISMQEAMELLK